MKGKTFVAGKFLITVSFSSYPINLIFIKNVAAAMLGYPQSKTELLSMSGKEVAPTCVIVKSKLTAVPATLDVFVFPKP